jgi:hypothetical protein
LSIVDIPPEITFFIKRNIIKMEQIRFCKNKRTSDHLFVLKTLIDRSTQQGYNRQLVELNFIFKENALFERKSKAKNKLFLTFDLNYAKT